MRTLVLVTLLAACSQSNPNYCPDHPLNNCNLDADINAPQGCSTSAQCTNSAKPICEDKICVACTDTDPGACAGITPVCTAANTCGGCTAHAQCDSAACLPSGACGDDSNVVYVTTGGDDAAACTRAAPCLTITEAATKGKPYIKLQSDISEAVYINGASVTILGAPGTSIRRPTNGPVITLAGTSTITIRDVAIRDGSSATGHGIVVGSGEPVNLTLDGVYVIGNTGTGIIAQGASLTMSRCVVSGNFGGGGNLATTFNITNSLFVRNGAGTSAIGGLQLSPSGTVNFKFNTVANNVSSNAVPGINCVLGVTAANTILAMNDSSSNCMFEYSLFDPAAPASGSNRAGDPKFKNTVATNPLATDYFRIQSASEAVDHGDPASTMATDIDGDARPSGTAPDIGADELN